MDAEDRVDIASSDIAAAIGEPARARMLYCLMDGHARTSTELSVVAEVSPSTASAHLNRLRQANLVAVSVQGKHRYYRLASGQVAAVLESLSVLAGGARDVFLPSTPTRLRSARTCYDHLAGKIGVALYERFRASGWFQPHRCGDDTSYDLTPAGLAGFEALGIDVPAVRALRRKFAFECLDWSERRPHLGGALGAVLLETALERKWLVQDLDSRALTLTPRGRTEMRKRFDITS